MSSEENKRNLEYWNEFYKDRGDVPIVTDDWLRIFNPIIDEARGPVVDLGCGEGNDTLYLLNRKKKVIPCDGSENAIKNIKKNFPDIGWTECFDMLEGLPFDNRITDLVIADLSLHYFRRDETIAILKEIKRILMNKGHMFARVNAIDDVNHGAGMGEEVEHHLYRTSDGRLKRFFDYGEIYDYFKMFDLMYLRKEPMKRYKLDKSTYVVGVRNRG